MNPAISVSQSVRTNRQAPGQSGLDALVPSRDPGAALAAVLAGAAAIAASNWAAGLTADVASFLLTRNAGPGVHASAYADAHFTDACLDSHPLLVAACGILVTAAMALTFTRRRLPAVLVLCAAAVVPWIPAIDFLHHVWQLALVSTRA